MKKHPRGPDVALLLALAFAPFATAQSVSAVPKLDANSYMVAWYEQAHMPNRAEKKCVSDGLVLYALADKKSRFQLVTSCVLKDGNTDSHNFNGKMSKTGDGRLKVTHLWPFATDRWVLALGPEYEWAVVGSPSHKALWLLTKKEIVDPATLDEIKAAAAAQGFDTAKLITVPQHRGKTN